MRDCFTPEIHSRFWCKVDIRGDDDCWPWLAGKTKDGYGLFHCHRGYTCTAHRYAAESIRGERMPKGLDASHICPLPDPDPRKARGCCNPKHVTFETRSQNCLRRDGKLRRNPHRMLNDDQVREVMRLYRQQGHRRGIAEQFGVDRQCIYKLTIGVYYRDVTGL